MVEFYVWVDGHLRTICALTQETSCWQVVEALSEATGKKEQHLLWEVWRDFGRPISPRESVMSLMRQWGQELPTVRFILRPKGEGSVVKRHAVSRKHKLVFYTEEQKVKTHKPKRKIRKSYFETDPNNIIVRECRQLNCRIMETMFRIRATKNSMDMVLQGNVATAIDSRIEETQKIEDSICEKRGVLRSLREENVLLRQNYIERLRQTQDLKREKEALEGTAHDLSTRASLMKDELQARNTTNDSLDLQVSQLQEKLDALRVQIQDKSVAAEIIEKQVGTFGISNTNAKWIPSFEPPLSPPRYTDLFKLSHLDSPDAAPTPSESSTQSDFSAHDLLTSLNAHLIQLPTELDPSATDVEDSDDIV